MRRNKRAPYWIVLLTACALPAMSAPRRASTPAPAAAFNGDRAFEDLKHLVSFGPRPAGSKPLSDSRKWIVSQLEQMGYKVEEDIFQADTPVGSITMINLRVIIPGTSPKVIMLAGHYDTARFEDINFVGANDGGSSAAFLLEMARVLAHRKNKFTTWLVFFDGEEAEVQWSATDSLYGSRHFVEKLTAAGALGRIQAMILVDMIGDAKLHIYRDAESTPWLTDVVFKTARGLGCSKYFLEEQHGYGDDHTPFVNAGVAAVDLLGNVGPVSPSTTFGSYWHTAKDTLDKCSPQSLTIVGRVVLGSIDALEKSPRLN
ncbi:MAG TPA: M28 family peptidase [Terriglobia bacterium]|nr:M28 family peptidase [Terriglobia bacterium]